MRRPLAIALLLMLLSAALAACGSGDSDKSDESSAQGGPAGATQPPAAATPDTCQKVSQPPPKPDGGGKKPTRPLDASKTWTLVVKTNCGDFTITLDLKAGPKASASMVGLAQAGFFNGTVFHRIVPGFVIQGGDPTGTGTGGPGYTFEDEFNDHKVERGALAMANAGPNTNGSQFFIVTAEATPWLDGKHTVFGKVTSGMDVVDTIEQTETDGRDKPLEEMRIESISLG